MDDGDALPAGELRAVFGAGAGRALAEPLGHVAVASATRGLWRVRAGDRSAVLKLVAHSVAGSENWRSGEAEDHWYYWRREANAYESGLLRSLTGGLRAPECHLVAEREDGSVALWLEDLRGEPAPAWSLPATASPPATSATPRGSSPPGGPCPRTGG